MTWQLFVMVLVVALGIIFLYYCAFMELIAQSHRRDFRMKDLLNGPGMYVKHIKNSIKEKK
jgi:hypothetical protein